MDAEPSMNKRQKVRFVKELSKSIADSVVESITSGKIPQDWDGIELRWLLADKYTSACGSPAYLSGRKRIYTRIVLANNL